MQVASLQVLSLDVVISKVLDDDKLPRREAFRYHQQSHSFAE